MTDFEDHDKTIIKPVADLGADPVSALGQNAGYALPAGTRLGEFQITSLIGAGTFGNVYLAQDYSLGRNVAIKEFMPSALAARLDGMAVGPRTGRHGEAFAAGLIGFINEARLLARFDHPSLVKVHRFWEANGTAYMAMPFYEGQTLAQTLSAMGEPPSERWLKDLLAPLLDALQLLHAQDCFHRDIGPDNIFVLNSGRPVLMDFGAARRAAGDAGRSVGAIPKPGYAPVEQYAQDSTVRQGAWTDIYALAAVVHFAIMGVPPPISVERVVDDHMKPLEQAAKGRYSENFLRAIDGALSLDPEKRPQSMQDMRVSLGLELAAAMPGDLTGSSQALPPPAKRFGKAKLVGAAVALAVLAIGAGFIFLPDNAGKSAEPSREAAASAGSSPALPPPSTSSAPSAPSAPLPQTAPPASAIGEPPLAAATPSSAAQPGVAGLQPSVPAQVPVAASQAPGSSASVAQAQATSQAAGSRLNAQTPSAGARPSASAPRARPTVAASAAGTARPVTPRAEPAQPQVAAPATAPPPVVAAPAVTPNAPAQAGRSPVDECGKNRLFLDACIASRCKWAEFVNHPMCVAVRSRQK